MEIVEQISGFLSQAAIRLMVEQIDMKKRGGGWGSIRELF